MRAPARGEQGTALVEAVWLSILLLVPLVYVMTAVFDVQRSSYGLSGAARAAARAYAVAPDEASAPHRARVAAEVALADQGVTLDQVRMRFLCRPDPEDCLASGASIRAELRQQVRLPLVPDALGGGAPTVRVEASHTVVYGRYRENR